MLFSMCSTSIHCISESNEYNSCWALHLFSCGWVCCSRKLILVPLSSLDELDKLSQLSTTWKMFVLEGFVALQWKAHLLSRTLQFKIYCTKRAALSSNAMS